MIKKFKFKYGVKIKIINIFYLKINELEKICNKLNNIKYLIY